MRGGRVFIAGDTGARAGISMKGGTLVVGGSVGYMSGFMMQRGTMIVCGDAADGIGDSMYEGTVYVGGAIASLGADCIEAEMADDDRALLAAELEPHGIAAERRGLEEARRGQEALELLQARVRRLEGGAVSDVIPRGRDGHVLQKLWVWSPETIEDIQTKAELGRYTNRGLGMTRRPPHFEDLTFVPCTLSRVPLEGYRETCATEIEIGARHGAKPIRLRTPITIAGMSYGALSRNAKAALGMAATRVGISTTTGDGGMLDLEREASDQLVYQVLPSRYGFNPHHLRMANAAEIVIGQGAKPGTGGVLLGAKVSQIIAEASARSRRESTSARPVRHPDFVGPDDLQIKIEELREATDGQIPIYVKIGACRVPDDVKLACKAGADVIVIDGLEGGTGASPDSLMDHTGIPTLAATIEAVAAHPRDAARGRRQPDRLGRDPKRRRRRQGARARARTRSRSAPRR